MGTPYEKEYFVTTSAADEVVELAYPGRCLLDRVAIVRIGGGDIDAVLYNRSFTGPALGVIRFVSDGGTPAKVVAHTSAPAALRAGDVVTIAGTGGVYDGTARVTSLPSEKEVHLSKAFSSTVTGGTITLSIPDEEKPLYRVLELSGADAVEVTPEVAYVNLDPVTNINTGVPRRIYVSFADAASYKVALRCRTGLLVYT